MIQTFQTSGSYSSAGAVAQLPVPQKSPSGGNRMRFVLRHLSISSSPQGALTSGVQQILSVTFVMGSAGADTMVWTTYLMSPTGALKGIGTLDLDFGQNGLIATAPPTTDTMVQVQILGDSATTTDSYFLSVTFDYV